MFYLSCVVHGPIYRLYCKRFINTAISRKVVAKSARDNHERYCGWFWVRCSSKKFERMAQQAVDVCLRVLEESNKRRFDNYTVRNSVLIISHITSRDCRVHIFAHNLSRNSCIQRNPFTVQPLKRPLIGPWTTQERCNTHFMQGKLFFVEILSCS